MKKQRLGQPDPFRVILRAYGEEHECEKLPAGWSENLSQWNFDPESFGFNLKHSMDSLKFVLGDADFIRKYLDKYGISAEIDFIFQKCQNNWTYKNHFTAQINFTAGYTNDRDFIEVMLSEGGLRDSTAINRRTNYDIGFDDTAVDLEVPEGMQLYELAKYDISGSIKTVEVPENHPELIPSPGLDTNLCVSVIPMTLNSTSFLPAKGLIWSNQGEVSDMMGYTDPYADAYKNSAPFLKVINQFSSANPISVKAKINIKFIECLEIQRSFRVRLLNIKDAVRTPLVIDTFGAETGSTWEKEFIFAINKDNIGGEFKLEIIFYSDYIEYPVRSFVLDIEGGINLEYLGNASDGPFSLKAYKYTDFGNKLLDRVYAGATYKNTILDALEANNMQLFITTSDAIRGLDTALIKTNLQDFEESFRCLFSSALKVNNTTKNNDKGEYEVCRKRDVFNPTNRLLCLGEVKELQIEQMPDDWEFNVFRYGYEKQEYDYPLGRQEFAATLEYLSELRVPSTKKQEAICKYRADYTGVHLIRYDYVNNEKKDSKSDNDIFVILAFKDATTGKWQAVPGPGITVGGLEGGGYFNILLSPHRNLRRNADYIRSILDKVSPVLTYVSGTETQSNIVSTYNGVSITEKTDEDMSGVTRLFRPMVVKCTTVVPDNLPELLGENPAGYFEFTWNQLKWKGFPIKVESLSAYKSAQQVYMVMHPDTPDDVQFKMFWRDPSKLYM